MTIRNLIASCSIVGVSHFSPCSLQIRRSRTPVKSAAACWAVGKHDHTVYFAETEGREDRQASFASLMEISGLYPAIVECRIQDLKSHRRRAPR